MDGSCTTHKEGAQCVDRQAINPCVITPDTDKNATCRVTNNLQQETNDVQDKYELDLRFHARHKHKMAKAKDSNILSLWDAQSKDKYGFIPIQDQLLPEVDLLTDKNPKLWDDHAAITHAAITSNATAFFKHEKFQGDIELDASLQGLGAKDGS